MGIIVPRFQFTAVARNRLRREALASLPAVDLVVRANRSTYSAAFTVLRAELTSVVSRLT